MSRGSLIQILADRATADPARAYLQVRGRVLTYGQMAASARALARTIQRENWDQGAGRIGVSLGDQEKLLTLIWACAYADIGVAFCAHCENPTQMLKTVAESGASALVTDIEAMRGQAGVRMWSPELAATSD